MAKAKDAFRTISEVAEWLDTPTHVLRFWESKFTQIKPVKGAGGRRYYRPADMDLLGGIKQLLHEEGMTIKGTQKLLREKGIKHVAGLGPSMSEPEPAATPAPASQPVANEAKPPAKPKAPPTPAPDTSPFQDALPFDEPSRLAPMEVVAEPQVVTEPVAPPQPAPASEPAFAVDLPPLPDALPDLPARSFGPIAANQDKLRNHVAEVAPLVQRLQQLQARMQGR